jgi:hypothetical protein
MVTDVIGSTGANRNGGGGVCWLAVQYGERVGVSRSGAGGRKGRGDGDEQKGRV